MKRIFLFISIIFLSIAVYSQSGTKVTSSLVPNSFLDNYATHQSKYGKGGYKSVKNTIERDAIYTSRRDTGMLVYVTATDKIYILKNGIANADWEELKLGGATSTDTVAFTKNNTSITTSGYTYAFRVGGTNTNYSAFVNTYDATGNPVDSRFTKANNSITIYPAINCNFDALIVLNSFSQGQGSAFVVDTFKYSTVFGVGDTANNLRIKINAIPISTWKDDSIRYAPKSFALKAVNDTASNLRGALANKQNILWNRTGSELSPSNVGDNIKAKIDLTSVLYVAKNGNDANTGSLGDPFLSIGAAITAASAGTTIMIMPGTYTENITFKAGVNLMCNGKFTTYITGNHTANFSGTVVLEHIILQSTTGVTLNFTGTSSQNLQFLECSINSGSGDAINWSNTNSASKILFEDGTCNVATSGASARCFYSTTGAAGSLIADHATFELNNPDNVCLEIGGAISFTHTADVVTGQMVVSGTASLTESLCRHTTATIPVLTTNSSGLTVFLDCVDVSTVTPIITGAGAFAYAGIILGGTGAGSASTLNGGLGSIALQMAPIKIRPGTLKPVVQDGLIEYDGTHFYTSIGAARYQVDRQTAGYVAFADTLTGGKIATKFELNSITPIDTNKLVTKYGLQVGIVGNVNLYATNIYGNLVNLIKTNIDQVEISSTNPYSGDARYLWVTPSHMQLGTSFNGMNAVYLINSYGLFAGANYKTQSLNNPLWIPDRNYVDSTNLHSGYFFNDTINKNLGIGKQTLTNTSGTYNKAIGNMVLNKNTTGNYNIGIGDSTLFENLNGNQNLAFGGRSLRYNTTGSYNTAIGIPTLLHNTTGTYNTGIGGGSLMYNTIGQQNTAIGAPASYNNTTGICNTSIGVSALYYNKTGSYNTAIGRSADYGDTLATENVSIGYRSLYSARMTSYTTAIGSYSLYYNVTGVNNVALGYSSGKYETASNTFYVNNRDLTNTATEKAGSLLYGTFNTTVANQTLTTNSQFTAIYGITTPNYKLSALNTAPASATDTGTLGEIRYTATYIYICTATNTWVRAALSTW